MKKLITFINAVLGGACIAFGGIAFLSIENKVTGAVFFTLGLFTIVTNGLNLFTGKVCYVFENKPGYIIDVVLIWLGNFVGTFLTARLASLTRIAAIAERAAALCRTKLDDNLLSIFILALFCNIFIYIAVDGFKNNEHQLGKYLALVFGVAGFILCGFEHCVANMFYFSMADMWSGQSFIYLLVMTAGNVAGGVIFPLARSFVRKHS